MRSPWRPAVSALPAHFAIRSVAQLPGSNSSPRHSVLLVTDSMDPSGLGAHMVTLATVLRKQLEFRIVFARVSRTMPWRRRAMLAGIRVITLAPADLASGSDVFVRLLRSLNPDIVHVHAGIAWEGHGCARAAREAGTPVVLRTEHLPYTLRPLRNPTLEACYSQNVVHADHIICVSDAARATFRMASVSGTCYRTIHNGISPAAPAKPRATTRKSLCLQDELLIITVARLTEQKQHAVLLKAMPRVLRACPDAHLLIVGEGPLDKPLRAMAATAGITCHVHFLGRRDDIPDLLAASDLFCLPSHFEGHPLALMEAMAAGLPVVATRSLGITEAVSNGATGILVPTNDFIALAAALIRVLSDKVLANRLGQSGKQVVSAEFSVERMAERTFATYREWLPRSTVSFNS